MTQRGMGLVGGNMVPVDVDNLSYDYESQSNKLQRVQDAVTTDYGNGDFQNTNGAAAQDRIFNAEVAAHTCVNDFQKDNIAFVC